MRVRKALVVDDDESVRAVVARHLGLLGYDVRTASQGLEAVRLIERETFDLLITDHEMPRITGVELIRIVRATSPETRAILMSGAVSAAGEARGAAGFLRKPFSAEELRGVLRISPAGRGGASAGRMEVVLP